MNVFSSQKGQASFGELAGYGISGVLILLVAFAVIDPILDVFYDVLDNSTNIAYPAIITLLMGLIGLVLVAVFIIGLVAPLWQKYRQPQQPY